MPAAPWGVWATLAWMLAVFAASLAAGFASVAGFLLYEILIHGKSPGEVPVFAMGTDGDFVAFSLLVQTALGAGVLMLAVALRRGYPPGEYLAAKEVGLREYVPWIILMVVYNAVSEWIAVLLDIPAPEWMVSVFTSADCMPCLMIGLIVIAPPFEEFFFRGFVFKGVQARLGSFWAIVFATVPWSLLHIQYESFYYIASLTGLGLVFALARWRTGSCLVPLLMHVVNNAVSSVEMLWYI